MRGPGTDSQSAANGESGSVDAIAARVRTTSGILFPTVVDTPIRLPYGPGVPTICRFYGILVQMYYNDHDPPHFHVVYNEFKAVIAINDLSILLGDLPPKAIGLVMEWVPQIGIVCRLESVPAEAAAQSDLASGIGEGACTPT